MLRWYVGPPVWDATFIGGCWRSPHTALTMLDLRTLSQQSQRGGTPGTCLFVGDVARADLQNRSDYRPIGAGSWYDIKPTGADRGAIPRRVGYTPKGDDLVGVILDLLTDGADPDGLDGPKPLMPTMEGRIELRFGQRHHERFRWGGQFTTVVRQMARKEFATLFADANAGRLKDAEHHRRVLDFWCEKYGLNGEDEWKELVPAALVKDVAGRLKHETTITENFTRADSTTLMGNLLTWTQVSGTWGTLSNECYKALSGAATQNARAESDLSSADHYAQVLLTSGGSGTADSFYGPAARFNAAANTCYVTANFSNVQYVTKVVAGTGTNLANAANTFAKNHTYKVECNGSTIKGYDDSVEKVSVTDTAITGNLRCGLTSYGIDATMDDFEASDLGGGGGGIVYTQLERGTRGLVRGTFAGNG